MGEGAREAGGLQRLGHLQQTAQSGERGDVRHYPEERDRERCLHTRREGFCSSESLKPAGNGARHPLKKRASGGNDCGEYLQDCRCLELSVG